MPISKRAEILIGIGSLIALALLLVGIIVVTHHTSRIAQDCPEDVRACNDKDHVYHVDTGKCFLKGESPEGVCGRYMTISPVPTCQIQGQCECDYENHDRLLLYHPEKNLCYFIYEQGPCDNGYVITLSRNQTGVTCELDICHELKTKVSDELRDLIVPYDNKCYPLYTKLNETGCKGRLKFWKNKVQPSCNPPATFKTGGLGSIGRRCPPGSYRAFGGKCQETFSFDF